VAFCALGVEGFSMNTSVQSITTLVEGNCLNVRGRLFATFCFLGQIKRVSLNTLAKKQIHVLNVLLTELGDIPYIYQKAE
jgi:hypothetical protein